MGKERGNPCWFVPPGPVDGPPSVCDTGDTWDVRPSTRGIGE